MKKGSGCRIVLTTVGSLGDLHPFLAIGVELARRGHRPVIASTEAFREHVEAAGLPFYPLRAIAAEGPDAALVRRVFDGRKGVEYILRELILPVVETAFEDTLAASEDAHLLIAHTLTVTTRLVAETRGIPWISVQLAPMSLLSATDPPVLPGLEWVHRLRPAPRFYRLFFRLAELQIRRWCTPFDALRRRLGLPEGGNPLFAGAHSPWRELALFSSHFGPPQPDWPAQTMVTGFPFFAQPVPPDPALEAFLTAGPPPIIFTLGSSAVMDAGDFFRVSAEAARRLGRRALLLGARLEASLPSDGLASDVFACRYASYAATFPRGAAIVHQGGVGTTAEALRAGRPMLIVPFGVDQPDNAARAARLGVARVLSRRRYRPARVTLGLARLLDRPGYAERASALGATIRSEHGAEVACDVIEAVLGRAGKG